MSLNASVREEITNVASQEDIEPAKLLAIVDVESAGVAYWTVGGKQVPPARPEGHYFYRKLKGAKLKQAVREGLAAPKAGQVKVPKSRTAVYEMIRRMEAIDKQAARESCSWGVGQVMGDHWQKLGYTSVDQLVNACMASIAGQVDLMVRYIKVFGLEAAVRAGGTSANSWKAFAKGYNGPRYYAYGGYHNKLATAYKKYAGTPKQAAKAADKEVKAWQADLRKLGYYKGAVDGLVGPQTKAALKAFQRDHGLVEDGKYGTMSRDAIAEALAAKAAKDADKAVSTGGVTTGIGAAGDTVLNQTNSLQDVAGSTGSQVLQWVVIALVVLGVGLVLYGLYKKLGSK